MGFWSTLGKIGSFAAPIIAAPFTGGASLAAIGALGGAAGGALSGGGLKGALTGGALGAIPGIGGIGGGAASGAAAGGAAKMGLGSTLGQIGKGLLTPEGLSSIGGLLSGGAAASAEGRRAEVPGQVGAYRANLEGTGMQDKRAALASLLAGGLQDASISRPAGSTIPTFGVTGGLRPSAMNQQALLDQLSKPIDPLALPKAGLGEKIAGGIGTGASILGALGGIVKNKATPQAAAAGAPPPQAPIGNASLLGNVNFGNGFVDPGVGKRNPWATY